MTGLEPATSGVTGRRSNQLSYIRIATVRRERRGASDRAMRGRRQLRLAPVGRLCVGLGAGPRTHGPEQRLEAPVANVSQGGSSV